MKKVLIIIICLITCIPQMDAQTKTQVMDDIESTLNDFISDINSLYERGMKPRERIREIGKAFASPDYFIYNNKQQDSFTRWLTQYEKNILDGQYFEHQLTLKKQTVKKVAPFRGKDKRWQFTAVLSRIDLDKAITYTDEISMIVLWNGDGDYVSILEINGEWQKTLIQDIVTQDEPVERDKTRFQPIEIIKNWWWTLFIIPIVFIVYRIYNRYSDKKQLEKAIQLYKNNRKDAANAIFQKLASKKVPEVYYYLSKYYKPKTPGYWPKGDFDKMLDYLYKAANAGHIESMYELSNIQIRNKDEAKYWCKKAAEQGLAEAQFKYSTSYADTDEEKFSWALKAAQNNNTDAMVNVGSKYMKGEGVEESKTKALEWWKKAADLGNSNAMFEIGNAYYSGAGVGLNTITAESWYQKAKNTAAKKSYTEYWTLYKLGNMYAKSNSLDAKDKAIECYSLIPNNNLFYKRAQTKIAEIKNKEEDLLKEIFS